MNENAQPGDRRATPADTPPATTPAEQSFARRVLIGVGITAGVVALLLFLWYSMHVLLLAFAAVLVGVLLRGSAEWVAGKLNIRTGWALGLVLLSLVGFFVLLGVFAAPSIVGQAENLADRIPQSLRKAEDKLRSYSWGRRILDDPAPGQAGAQGQQAGQQPGQQQQSPPAGQSSPPPATPPSNAASTQQGAPPASKPASQPTSQPATQPTLASKVLEAGTSSGAVGSATRMVNRILQAVLTVVVIMVTGIYLAAHPEMYVDGLLMLAPHARRPRYREILGRLAFVLRHWMIAQLIPMVVIGSLTAIGLKVIGVPMWLFLGLLAAIFNFIPNFGPLISGVPAFLMALAESPAKAMWVVVLYVVAQSLEGYVLTPLVQRRAIELPPGVLILFQVLAGLLLGALGVVLAAPLLAVVVVAIKMLYVEDVLGDDADVPGEGAPASAGPGSP